MVTLVVLAAVGGWAATAVAAPGGDGAGIRLGAAAVGTLAVAGVAVLDRWSWWRRARPWLGLLAAVSGVLLVVLARVVSS